MPTNLLRSHREFDSANSVLATEQGMRSPRMATFDNSFISPDPSNPMNLILPAGSIICRLGSGLGRVYPAAVATAATPTTSNTISVADPSIFKPGDALKKGLTPIGTIASIDLVAKTITLAANATAAVAAGDTLIANSQAPTTILGITVTAIDLKQTSNDVACFTSASVWGARLPYWDATVQAALPEITLV